MKSNKLLGQHFLRDRKALKKIIQAADLSKEDAVLEVGPGHGELTFELAKMAGFVLAVEKDKKLAAELKKRFVDAKNVKIIEGDILKSFHKVLRLVQNEKNPPSQSSPFLRGEKKWGDYKIVANIPYYLTSRLIKNFLEASRPPKLMVLMLQKEMAQRICARPPKMSILAVSVQVYAKPEIISHVSKRAFWPQPKVDSAIIKISQIKTSPHYSPPSQWEGGEKGGGMKNFFKLVKAGFFSPRKQLINNLSKGLKIPRPIVAEKIKQTGLQPTQRAETLSVENWQKLADVIFRKNIV